MNPRLLLLAAAFAGVAVRVGAAPVDPAARSVSGSRQFIVYCPEPNLRGRIAGLAEEVKADFRELLAEGADRWKIPIVITLDRARRPGQAPVKLQMIATPDGTKIEINAEAGDDPASVNLQKQIARAVCLEIAWRDRPPIRSGERYLEAPWWLVDGALGIFRKRDLGVDTALFRRLVESNKLPSIEQFLALQRDNLGTTAEAIDSACAMGFVQMLLDQPDGRASLGRLLRHWPNTGDDPMSALTKDFPGLASKGTAQKLWTLNLARFAASDRYQGLPLAETDARLAKLLEIELPIDKAGTKKTFALHQHAEFLKLPTARTTMAARQKAAVALSIEAHALLRPVIAEYERIFALLARGKTRNLADQIVSAESYRNTVLHRMGEITDYLNWYEATQLGTRSNDFDSYLKAAKELSREPDQPSEEVRRYMDVLEKEY